MSGYPPPNYAQVPTHSIQFYIYEIDKTSRFVADGIYMEYIYPINVSGRFCDLFVGYHSAHGKVALKRLRGTMSGHDDADIQRFRRETDTWRCLDHPNILKFLGTFSRNGFLYMMSPFIDNGTLLNYLTRNPQVNRRKLLLETARALLYLHDSDTIHADIKAQNILVDRYGSALLCDFGLTRLVSSYTSIAMKGAGSIRWQSPELWEDEHKSFQSDVWAFGMTIYQVLSGKVPFHDLQTDVAVILAVMHRDERPPLTPAHCNFGRSYQQLWTAAESCWQKKPSDRPDMLRIVSLLESSNSLPPAVADGKDPCTSSMPELERFRITPPAVVPSSAPMTVSHPGRIVDHGGESLPLFLLPLQPQASIEPLPPPCPPRPSESSKTTGQSRKRSSQVCSAWPAPSASFADYPEVEETRRTEKRRGVHVGEMATTSSADLDGLLPASHGNELPDGSIKDVHEGTSAVTGLKVPMSNTTQVFQCAYGGDINGGLDSVGSDRESRTTMRLLG